MNRFASLQMWPGTLVSMLWYALNSVSQRQVNNWNLEANTRWF